MASGFRWSSEVFSDVIQGNFFIAREKEKPAEFSSIGRFCLKFVGRDGFPIIIKEACAFHALEEVHEAVEALGSKLSVNKIDFIASQELWSHEYPVFKFDPDWMREHKERFWKEFDAWKSMRQDPVQSCFEP